MAVLALTTSLTDFSLSHSVTLPLTHSHSHTLTHSHSLTLSLSHSLTLGQVSSEIMAVLVLTRSLTDMRERVFEP